MVRLILFRQALRAASCFFRTWVKKRTNDHGQDGWLVGGSGGLAVLLGKYRPPCPNYSLHDMADKMACIAQLYNRVLHTLQNMLCKWVKQPLVPFVQPVTMHWVDMNGRYGQMFNPVLAQRLSLYMWMPHANLMLVVQRKPRGPQAGLRGARGFAVDRVWCGGDRRPGLCRMRARRRQKGFLVPVGNGGGT